MTDKELALEAVEAQNLSYSPYSKFRVGAALLTEENKLYTGANIENASYGLTVCAERNAIFKAVLEGEKKFKAIAIAGDSEGFCPPCGACRQVLTEFCDKELDVILIDKKQNLKTVKLKELLPLSFDESNL